MPIKIQGVAIALGFFLGLAGSGTVIAGDKSAEAQQAIEKAEKSLAAAAAAGSVWQLIDKATGSGSASLDKLLGAAKEKSEAGDFDEAIRIADKVSDAAMLGVEQAESQKGKATPFYP
jgi:hypothetical protein